MRSTSSVRWPASLDAINLGANLSSRYHRRSWGAGPRSCPPTAGHRVPRTTHATDTCDVLITARRHGNDDNGEPRVPRRRTSTGHDHDRHSCVRGQATDPGGVALGYPRAGGGRTSGRRCERLPDLYATRRSVVPSVESPAGAVGDSRTARADPESTTPPTRTGLSGCFYEAQPRRVPGARRRGAARRGEHEILAARSAARVSMRVPEHRSPAPASR